MNLSDFISHEDAEKRIEVQERINDLGRIEFKFGKNKLTPEQREFGDYLVEHNYMTGVAYTVDEALEILQNYLGE